MHQKRPLFSLHPFVTGIACLLTALLCLLSVAGGQGVDGGDEEINQYMRTPPKDAIARLQAQMDRGGIHLDYNSKNGYLAAVLKQLSIPDTSQILVFSKTSFQRQLISPERPRALYFNERTYVGYIPGAPVLEIATVDPQFGAEFYVLDQQASERPRFIRQTFECIQCHGGSMTEGVPGIVMRSVYARRDGQPDLRSGSFLTSDQSPMRERWGGLYVTGTHGAARHLGNVFAQGTEGQALLDTNAGANVTDLKGRLNTAPYLTPHSDIVALMILGHQTKVQNLLTSAAYQTRALLREEEILRKSGALSETELTATRSRRLKSACEPLLKALLFAGEAPLSGPIAGVSGFSEPFERHGPKDSKGRSLYQLDLQQRLLRYPCSYLLYSEAFDSLPTPAKEYLYRRLQEILRGQDSSADFAYLSETDRTAILEILTETKPDFAAAREVKTALL